MKLRHHNALVKEAMIFAGQQWVAKFLAGHFTPGAVQRYKYPSRTAETNKIKRRMKRVRPWISGGKRGAWKTAPKPPAPNVWSGDMRDKLLSKSPQEFRIIAAATSKKQTCKVNLPVPHPINPAHKGEIGRIIDDEMRFMSKLAFEYYQDRINSFNETVEVVLRG